MEINLYILDCALISLIMTPRIREELYDYFTFYTPKKIKNYVN